MNRKKNRVADAVTLDMWAIPVPEKKEQEPSGPCDICGKSTIIDFCNDGTPVSMVLCSPECASKYIDLYDRVLESVVEVIESDQLPTDELPVFSDDLPDFEDELPEEEVKESIWYKGFEEKEGEVSKERYELVTQKMRNKYIGAYLILHPEKEIDEMETRIDSHYLVWINKKHDSFCKEMGIKRKEGYSSKDILDFHEFLYRPINQVLGSC